MKTHLLVDLDGTLLASNKVRLHSEFVFRSLLFMSTQKNISPWKTLLLLRELRKTLETPGSSIQNDFRAAAAAAKLLSCSQDAAQNLLDEWMDSVFPQLVSCFSPIEGAQEFIEWSSKRYRLVLATNPVWPLRVAQMRLAWAGLTPGAFEFITSMQQMHSCKPSAEYYFELIEKLGIQAEQALMIGDSVRKDLPATQAGIPVFLLAKNDLPQARGERAWEGNFNALKRLLESESV